MPARVTYFRCICIECAASGGRHPDGSPIGCEILTKDRAAHYLQVRKNQSQIDDLASDVFTLTLSDGARPNMSHITYQATTLPQPNTRLPESSQISTSELFAPPSTGTNGILNSSENGAIQEQDNALAAAFANLTISTSHPNLDRRQSAIRLNYQHVKHRRNVRLKRSAKIVEDINTRIQNCCDKIEILKSTTDLLPIQETLSFLEKEIGVLRHGLETTTYVNVLTREAKHVAVERLKAIDAYVTNMRMAFQPAIDDGPVSYNSAHHLKSPIDEHHDIAQGALLLGVICSVIMGVARSGGDFIMVAIRYLLGLAFMQGRGGQSPPADNNVLSQIPITIATALSKFNLDARVRIYATCPACHFTHPPKYVDGSSIATYPERCTNVRKLPKLKDGDIGKAGPGLCDTPLLHAIPSHTAERKPLKPFIYHEFHDYLSGLLSQEKLEKQADKACDDLIDAQRSGYTASDSTTNPFEGDFLKTFKGPSGDRLFVDRQGEGRFVFSLNVDFFNPEGVRARGPTVSAGIISMACLNLPVDIRYKPENMYLSIIPGPREPHHMELNHYLRPLVDDMVVSWKHGIRLSKTASSSHGRVTRSAIACAVCDLPGARKASQLAGHGAHRYCTVCRCKDRATLWRSDVDHPDWQLQDNVQLRRVAEEYRDITTWEEQEAHFKVHGVRWTELWRLPYWNPSRQLVVDPMHCILEGVVHAHCREILCLTTVGSLAKDKVIPAFSWPFKVVNPKTDANGRTEKDFKRFSKQVEKIHTLLIAPIVPPDAPLTENLGDNSEDEEQVKPEPLVESLKKNNLDALQFVCNDLNCRPEPIRHTDSSGNILLSQRFTKIHWAQALVKWRHGQPLQSEKPQPIKYGTPEVMARIQKTIKNTITPSWVDSVPYNFGDAAAGNLKANEWRTLATIYLPIALVLSWGEGTVHPSSDLKFKLRQVLDHTMALFSATRLACMRYTNSSRISAYRELMVFYVRNLEVLYPDAPKKTNPHMSLHIYEFLKLFGPVYSWWCFPFERLIGILQRQPTNHKFGELEATMLQSFLKGGKLRRWLSNPSCPPTVKKMKQFFDRSFTHNIDDTLGTWNDDPSLDTPCENTHSRQIKHLSQIPEELQPLTRNGISQLRARVHHNGYIYSTSSAHLGNSLVYFYPGGNRQSSPVPASIKYIFTREGSILYAVQRQLNISEGTLDPFKAYPHFPAKLYSTQLSQSIEAVNPEWVMCHYARCDITESTAVVLALSQY